SVALLATAWSGLLLSSAPSGMFHIAAQRAASATIIAIRIATASISELMNSTSSGFDPEGRPLAGASGWWERQETGQVVGAVGSLLPGKVGRCKAGWRSCTPRPPKRLTPLPYAVPVNLFPRKIVVASEKIGTVGRRSSVIKPS